MAAASDIAPSENKTYYLRWMSLIVDGGTLVLRNQLDQRIPPSNLGTELNKSTNRRLLTSFISKGFISKQHEEVLYPSTGTPSSATFDVSLLTFLLRNWKVCGLNAKSPVWKGVPPPLDHSVEADIARLRLYRNEVSHQTSSTMTEQQFLQKWSDIEQVLYRLGGTIPDLKKNVEALKVDSIDPKKEKEYEEEIRRWEVIDTALQAEVEEVKTKLQAHDAKIQGLSANISSLDAVVSNVEDNLKEKCNTQQELKDTLERHKDVISSITSKCDLDRTSLEKLDKKSEIQESQIEVIYARVKDTELKHVQLKETVTSNNQELGGHVETVKQRLTTAEGDADCMKQSVQEIKGKHIVLENSIKEVKKKAEENMSSELRSLASISKTYFEKVLATEPYVETSTYREAKSTLLKNNVVILSGHPGEGKTTMANRLVSEVSTPATALMLRDPFDWKHVDVRSKLFNCVLIDDIFGDGVMDEDLVKKWKKYLENIELVTFIKRMYVIITTRHYILEEAKQQLKRTSLFESRNLQILSSGSLSRSERADILRVHMEQKDRQIKPGLIDSCVDSSESFLDWFRSQDRNFMFGFPECVSMFVNNDDLFQRGPAFFQKPDEFFKRCLEAVNEREEKFLALVIIWSRKTKSLPLSELDLTNTSHEVKRIAKKFGVKPKARLIKVLKKSLEQHKKGFLDFDSSTGAYSFSHNIVDDMTGLVLSKDYPKETLDLCSRDFLVEYVTTDPSKNDEFHLFVEKHRYEQLQTKILQFLFRRKIFQRSEDFLKINMRGHSPKIKINRYLIDPGILRHDAFKCNSFVQSLVRYFARNNLMETVLNEPIMHMFGYFLSYGICIDNIGISLSSYFLLNGNGLLFIELMQKRRTNTSNTKANENEMTVPFLLAVHAEMKDVVHCLLTHGAEVTEDAIYIAAQKADTELLSLLLQNRKPGSGKNGHVVNGNNVLIVSAKKGLTNSVKRLVDHGVDLNYRNKDNMSALDKAVVYKHEDICEILIEKGAPLDVKTGKFKRTPLLVAADQGLTQTVRLLLQHGASVNVRDKRGNYAIHCAAFQGHTEIVKALVQHDIAQIKLRIASHGQKSILKGMTVCHIAVWKYHHQLLDTLVELNVDTNVQDTFGRTPFYCAVYRMNRYAVEKMMNVCDISRAEKQGFTPLHTAVHNGDIHTVTCLCPHVNVNACDKFGKTPLHIACEKVKSEIALLLVKQFHADINMTTKKGETIFSILDRQKKKKKKMVTATELLNEIRGIIPEGLHDVTPDDERALVLNSKDMHNVKPEDEYEGEVTEDKHDKTPENKNYLRTKEKRDTALNEENGMTTKDSQGIPQADNVSRTEDKDSMSLEENHSVTSEDKHDMSMKDIYCVTTDTRELTTNVKYCFTSNDEHGLIVNNICITPEDKLGLGSEERNGLTTEDKHCMKTKDSYVISSTGTKSATPEEQESVQMIYQHDMVTDNNISIRPEGKHGANLEFKREMTPEENDRLLQEGIFGCKEERTNRMTSEVNDRETFEDTHNLTPEEMGVLTPEVTDDDIETMKSKHNYGWTSNDTNG